MVNDPVRRLGIALLVGIGTPAAIPAQDTAWTEAAAGPQYRAGPIKRLFFGTDYRPLWTTPVRVPYLDLGATAGGLTPTTAGGGVQTKSLRFIGADGYEYGFRSVDKSLGNMPPALVGTFVEQLALDQTSAQHPAAPAIVAPLAQAAGLLSATPVLVVLPDDPRLGPHRERFKQTMGYFERRATIPAGAPPFAGALEIIDSDELLRRLEAGPADRADRRTFLKARLFDLLIGDRDRHRGQWTWARLVDESPRIWVPIPEDRDQAFVRFDGLVPWMTRRVTGQLVHFEAGELLNYDEGYGRIVGATWSGRELDRRLLPALERPVWDSIARDLQARLTDSVIDVAVRRMPAEYQAVDAEPLRRRLRARRERLPEFADRFYRVLAHEAELHGTDAAELVEIRHTGDGRVHARMAPRERPDASFLERTFLEAETDELRIFLHRGRDSMVVRGPGSAVRIHVVANGDDAVVDSSGARRPQIHTQPYRLAREGRLPPRDWGHQWDPAVILAAAPDLGLVVGGGPRFTRYGFRKYPYAYAVQVRAGLATGPLAPAADLRITAYARDSRVRGELYLRGTGLAMVRFHGLGNDVALTEREEFYRVNQRQFEITPTLLLPLGDAGSLRLGPTAVYHRTVEQDGRIIAALRPYGSGNFGQVGFAAETRLEGGGAGLTLGIRAFPPAWDVERGFVSGRAQAVAHLGPAGLPLRPVLALRAGGKVVRGRYPFQEAAFLGDPETVRLGRQNRYGGDAAVWGNAELRLRLGAHRVLLPGEIGVSGLADAGRVFLRGEASDTWHTAWGGGLWLSVLDPGNLLSVQLARSVERTAVYARFGFAF
jgi:hypothetical protein